MIESDGLLIGSGRPDESRRSLVRPDAGEQLLHADLHNHTLLSDGNGRPEDVFASMRAAGLDVAAVTDHAHGPSTARLTIDEADWQLLGELADAAYEPGEFVAIRGFEWTSASLGHMNVWGGRNWTKPLPLAADGARRGEAVAAGPPRDPVAMAKFYRWLDTDPDFDGGRDALVSFNHPGRESGRFGEFRFDPRIADRLVGLEMFNRGDDYLFERVDLGGLSPLVECLDAGWRPGLIGVTDEHSERWGFVEGLGRTGVWSTGRDRAAVREAMLRRRLFATRERNLRVDAVAHLPGGPAPMGSTIAHRSGDLRIELDVFGGPDRFGRVLRLQVLQTGDPLPTVVAEREIAPVAGSTVEVTVPVDRADGNWVVLRLADLQRSADRRARRFPAYRDAGRALAYLSPFYLAD